jgi:hypothetical protein
MDFLGTVTISLVVLYGASTVTTNTPADLFGVARQRLHLSNSGLSKARGLAASGCSQPLKLMIIDITNGRGIDAYATPSSEPEEPSGCGYDSLLLPGLEEKKETKRSPWKEPIISNFMIYDYWSSVSQEKKKTPPPPKDHTKETKGN